MVLCEEDDAEQRHNPEEQPLSVAGKSWSEMIEDQIQESAKPIEAKKVHPIHCYVLIIFNHDAQVERRPFLRRGVGLTRFNLPPDPAQQPSQAKRSQSHPRLSDIQSRLTQVG